MKTMVQLRDDAWNKPRWDGRVKLIGSFIPADSRIIDLGAGAGSLKQFLPFGCTYTPADLDRTTPETRPLNWDEGVYPEGRWSIAVLSGSIEYAADPRTVLWAIRNMAPTAIVSYEHGGTLTGRKKNGFRSHLSKAGLEAEFERTGWSYREIARWKSQIIYLLSVLK